MKKTTLFLLILVLILSCKEKPSYNPFDNQVTLNKEQLLKDGMDTVIVGCGYYNLSFTEKRFSPYYQYLFNENDQLQAKGFNFIVDTIKSFSNNLDSITSLEYDLKELNKELAKFKFKITRKKDSLLLTNRNASINLKAYFSVDWINDSTFIRHVSYFTPIKN